MNNSTFKKLIRRINWYPPFLGMGIKVTSFRDDFTRFEVELRTKWYTKNLFGTHFGGSLYTMADPFFVFIITTNLGNDYIVWDKSAAIEFIKPAKGTILAIFEISQRQLSTIKQEVDNQGKKTYHFSLDLVDEQGGTVARVNKEVYVRAKAAKPIN